jgi:hypothetical protein
MFGRQGNEHVCIDAPAARLRMLLVVSAWVGWRDFGWVFACTLLVGGLGCGYSLGGANFQTPVSATAEWHASNGPLLAEYLKTLPQSAVGQPLKGIRLSGDSEGSRWLEGQIYRGVPVGLPEGLGVRLVDDGQRVLAFVWVENGAAAYELQACESGEQEGIRARLAGGGSYAWTRVLSEHGVVYTACPPPEWLPQEGPLGDGQSPPTTSTEDFRG